MIREASVLAAIDRFSNAYLERNSNKLLSYFIEKPAVITFGDGGGVQREGLGEVKLQVKKDWLKADDIDIELKWYTCFLGANLVCKSKATLMSQARDNPAA